MKFLLSVAAVIAVAVAVPAQRGLVAPGAAGPAPAPEQPFEPIAIGPAIIDSFEPIAVGPAIVGGLEGIAVGPAIIDFPLPEGAVAEEPAIIPSPVSVVEGGAATEIDSGTPLVQIIVNINKAAAEYSPIAVGPAVLPAEIQPTPVHVVDVAPTPVQVVEVAPTPVQVVEVAPVPAEPISIGTPTLPIAVVPPIDLN